MKYRDEIARLSCYFAGGMELAVERYYWRYCSCRGCLNYLSVF